MKFDLNKLNISSSLKYRAMFIAGGVAHSVFLVCFYMAGIMPLVYVNIGSVMVYVLGSLFSVRKSTGTVKYGWMIVFFSEIVIHSVLCTLLLGWDPSFHLYLLVIMPIAIYVLFFSTSIGKFLVTVGVMIIVDFGSVIASGIILTKFEMLPYYPLSYSEATFLDRVNLFLSAVILVFFAMLFALEIYGLLHHLGETNKKLEYIANHDQLTGLYNRHSIKPMVNRIEISGRSYCVALGDIDDFKKVNDTYGHDAGDETLRQVADAIKCGIGDGDIACRWGGEELLLITVGNRAECLARINAIRDDIVSRKMKNGEKDFNVTVTIGIADNTEAEGLERLVSLADERLYHGKKNGKNMIVSE